MMVLSLEEVKSTSGFSDEVAIAVTHPIELEECVGKGSVEIVEVIKVVEVVMVINKKKWE